MRGMHSAIVCVAPAPPISVCIQPGATFGLRAYLEAGRLVELFPDWPGEVFPLYAIHPFRRHPAAKVRAFLEFCGEVSKNAVTAPFR